MALVPTATLPPKADASSPAPLRDSGDARRPLSPSGRIALLRNPCLYPFSQWRLCPVGNFVVTAAESLTHTIRGTVNISAQMRSLRAGASSQRKILAVTPWVVDDPVTLKLHGTGEAGGAVLLHTSNRFILPTKKNLWQNKRNPKRRPPPAPRWCISSSSIPQRKVSASRARSTIGIVQRRP